jgi:alpha-L-fucosidase
VPEPDERDQVQHWAALEEQVAKAETVAVLPSEERRATYEWFAESRFGLWVHWGLFAMAARHQWVQSMERISPQEYRRRYFERFDPDLYEPAAWAREAKNAGMGYAVITAKHCEGFCLWDSDLSEYTAPHTPAGRDLLLPWVEAFRAEGLRVGLHYVLFDWHHPQFPLDGLHPLRDDLSAREEPRDIAVYREYLHGQVRELLTRFGPLYGIYLDYSYSHQDFGWSKGKGKDDWDSERLLAMVRELQPEALVTDRLEIPGDFATPEQYQPVAPPTQDGKPVPWEAWQTMSGAIEEGVPRSASWGYHRDNLDWKPVGMLVRMLVDTVSKGGNLLLNVGPTARGELDAKSIERLRGIGEWMRLHSKAIRGCGASNFRPPPDCRYTQRGDRLYLHIFSWPFRHLHLEGLAGRVEYAQLLNDGSELRTLVVDPGQSAWQVRLGGIPEGTLTLELPVQAPDVAVPVVELFLAER